MPHTKRHALMRASRGAETGARRTDARRRGIRLVVVALVSTFAVFVYGAQVASASEDAPGGIVEIEAGESAETEAPDATTVETDDGAAAPAAVRAEVADAAARMRSDLAAAGGDGAAIVQAIVGFIIAIIAIIGFREWCKRRGEIFDAPGCIPF